MARTAPEKSNFFMRCNYKMNAQRDSHIAAVSQEQSAGTVTQQSLTLVQRTIAVLEAGGEDEAALRRLWASLLEIKALRPRDPGVRTAAQDLYEAAIALVMDRRARGAVVDIRRRRLLKEADCRLRERLGPISH
jgi:DNA-binding SARP family transcriptional activator